MKTYTEEELLNKTASWCSTCEHCISEINDKLKRQGASEKTTEHIIAKLLKEKFIDETRYARAFVRDKYRFNKWGIAKIRMALKIKQISSKDIDIACDEINKEEYLSILKDLIQAKRKSVKAKDEYEMNGKLIRFALSKGYEIDDIRLIMGL